MNLRLTLISRRLWRRREVYRFRKWKAAKIRNDLAARKKWSALYGEARSKRRLRDRQLAEMRKNPTMISDNCIKLVAEFEGFRAHAYRDPVGVLTQGYGETQGVTPGKAWSESYARKRLEARLARDYMPAVLAAGRGKLNQNQLDSMTSFVYNVGPGGVSSSTGVGRALRAGRMRDAADGLLQWTKAAGRELPGLVRRRKAERSLFLR